jgi:hypothetical protein
MESKFALSPGKPFSVEEQVHLWIREGCYLPGRSLVLDGHWSGTRMGPNRPKQRAKLNNPRLEVEGFGYSECGLCCAVRLELPSYSSP